MNYIEGGTAVIDALRSPPPSESTLAFFRAERDSIVNDTTGMYSQDWVQRVADIHDTFWDASYMNQMNQILQQNNNIVNPNRAYPIYQVNQIPYCSVYMQRWIMSYPELRELYYDSQCYGFEDTYVDISEGFIGMDDYNYRRVVDNMVNKDYKGKKITISSITESLKEGDRELMLWEKINIMSTWNTVARAISEGIDPTDKQLPEI